MTGVAVKCSAIHTSEGLVVEALPCMADKDNGLLTLEKPALPARVLLLNWYLCQGEPPMQASRLLA